MKFALEPGARGCDFEKSKIEFIRIFSQIALLSFLRVQNRLPECQFRTKYLYKYKPNEPNIRIHTRIRKSRSVSRCGQYSLSNLQFSVRFYNIGFRNQISSKSRLQFWYRLRKKELKKKNRSPVRPGHLVASRRIIMEKNFPIWKLFGLNNMMDDLPQKIK